MGGRDRGGERKEEGDQGKNMREGGEGQVRVEDKEMDGEGWRTREGLYRGEEVKDCDRFLYGARVS